MNAFKLLAAMLCLGAFAIGASAAPAPLHTKTHAKPAAADSARAAQAKIDMKTARATALARIPGGAVQSEELEPEHGKLIYSFDLKVKGKPGIDEVNVDAITGAIVAVSHEGPKTERKEATAEKKAASTGARH